MTENLKKFTEALNSDKTLKEKFETELKGIAEQGAAESDKEAYVKTAKALGFDISESDLDKAAAEAQDLDVEELNRIAGGVKGWCVADYECLTAFMHDKPTSDGQACWSDYSCVYIRHGGGLMQKPGCGPENSNPDNNNNIY